MPAIKELPPMPERLGQYLLRKWLGGGGMGDVFEASHVMMQARRVAIKLLKPQLAENPQLVQRFLREIAALGGVKAHPNLVRAEFADIAGNVPYLVMEYVEGVDLNQVLKDQGPLSIADACNCIHQAALGLEAIHQAKLVHRDLKPSNLMLTRDGVVKILDLGLARLQVTEGPVDDLTSAHCLLGTMDFTSPEQVDDPRTVDIRADIYSLGCSLYKLLTDRTPFAEYSTVAQKIQAHASVPFPALPSGTPAELQAIVAKMTAKRPSERFANPTELAEALGPFSLGSTLKAKPVEVLTRFEDQETPGTAARQTVSYSPVAPPVASVVGPPPRWSRRRKALVAAGVLFVGLCITLATLWRFREPVDPYNVDNLEPMRWHPLFVREPMKLHWTQTDRAGHTKFDEPMQRFFITNHDMAYFKVGTTQKRNYKFQVTLSTVAWERVGVFFGYRTPKDDPTMKDDEIARFQYVSFGMVGEKPNPALERGRAILKRESDESRIVRHGYPLKLADLTERLGERVLEISVSKDDLVRVFLDNVELRELSGLDPNDSQKENENIGAFGTFTHNNSCHFRDAKTYVGFPDNEISNNPF